MKSCVRSEVPDALFELVGDGVVAVIVLVDAGEAGGELDLVAHAEDLDPGLGGPVVPGGAKGHGAEPLVGLLAGRFLLRGAHG